MNLIINKLGASAERVQFGKYIVYALDSYLYRSECGNELAQRYDADFAFVYRYQMISDEWRVSLRGVTEKSIDLTHVAAEYGGGGHPLASGFTYKGDLRNILKPTPQADGFSDE